MDILLLGGTGAMGTPLVEMLAKENNIFVTSRKVRQSTDNVHYIQGNAKDISFLRYILNERKYDVIVDFMVHSAKTFEMVVPLMLDNTKQYIFISSARVYAQSECPITEQTPRLLDASTDAKYLKTNEYALAKAREENLLLLSGRKNFTIIRPSITYNTNRLQLGVLEKESWLYRALHGRTIVLSHDIDNKLTTMTCGDDVARGIASIVGKQGALGEAFHITYGASMPWSEVFNIYKGVLEQHLGCEVPVLYTDKSTNFKFKRRRYQLVYCRYFNRTFDNSKIGHYCDVSKFVKPEVGLSNALSEFLQRPKFANIVWEIEAVNDRVAGEFTPLHEIPGLDNRLKYLAYRFNVGLLYRCGRAVCSGVKKLIKL